MKTNLRKAGLSRLLRWASAFVARGGHGSLAAQLFRAAESFAPTEAPPFSFARALWQAHQFDDAKLALQKILSRTPTHPEANNLLGIIYFEEEEMQLAGEHFHRAMSARQDFAAPYNNLGNIYLAKGSLEEAERWYRRSLKCDPEYVEALTNLGVILNFCGDNIAAENSCRKAVKLAPEFAGAHCNLGNVLLSLNRSGEAVAVYREALRLQPNLPEALVNLALVMEDSSYLAGTIDYYQKQAQRQPKNYLPHLRIAQALQGLRCWDDARQSLTHALELKHEASDVLLLLGINYVHVGDVRRGIGYLRQSIEANPNATAKVGIAFNSLYLDECTGDQLLTEFTDWAELYTYRLTEPARVTDDAAGIERRLRIGYVSGDFARHSVAYFLEPILRNHDRSKFEVFCYSTLVRRDDFTDRFQTLAEHWREISSLPENKIVELIKDDGIDILVDLSGHTVGSRLGVFASKPAPVQITYLGHPATTGLSAIDYRLCDAVTDPTALTASHYAERPWQLPGCFLTYQPPEDAPAVAKLPSLTRGYVTFGSFNNIAKVNDAVIGLWSKILTAIPSSRLVLKGSAFVSSHGRERVLNGFIQHGIAPDRLDLIDWRPDIKNHLELYGEIDIALDPFPYNGTTTTCEALWMGIPVICLEGDRHSGRVGESLLKAVGMNELIASSLQDYIAKAIDLANTPDRLEALREEMRDRMGASLLLDHSGFTRNLEAAYQAMWQSYCEEAKNIEPDASRRQQRDIELPLADSARIIVPDSLNVITRYVLEERGDWFEDEIRYVRQYLLPGMNVVDIGANYGTYSLSAAAAIGSTGTVWAFEPSASVAGYLRQSANLNQFNNLHVIQYAVSDYVGEAFFSENSNSELSKLVSEKAIEEGGTQSVRVPVTTMDQCRDESAWGKIDFLKIDAEGSEPQVVRGGVEMLMNNCPLVMAEYKHGDDYNETIVDEFGAIGFHPYRLVRGLMLLIPFQKDEFTDTYLLNLFFCTPDKAEQLEARGLLVRDGFAEPDDPVETYEQVLESYQYSQRTDLPAHERLAALKRALNGIENVMAEHPSFQARLALARIFFDAGFRDRARVEYDGILKTLPEDAGIPRDVLLLLPSGPYEHMDTGINVRQQLKGVIAEWLATYSSYSSFFDSAFSLHYLRIAHTAGLPGENVRRRINLLNRYIHQAPGWICRP